MNENEREGEKEKEGVKRREKKWKEEKEGKKSSQNDTCCPCSVDISVSVLKKNTELMPILSLRIKNMHKIHKTPHNI